MSKKVYKLILPILLFLSALALSSSYKEEVACAADFVGSSRYELTYEDNMNYPYVKGGEKDKRTVYVSKELYNYLDYITYDVVTSESTDIMYERISTSKGKAVNPGVTVARYGVVAKDDLKPFSSSDKRAYCFTVESDCCCAFIFTVYYTISEGDEQEVNYGSPVLYLKTVDSLAPTVTVKSYNRFLYTVTCSFNDTYDNCAASGTKSYTVYQADTTSGNKKVFLSSDKVYKNTATFTLTSGMYNYYVTATDAVGNESKETLIATFDVDELLSEADSAIRTVNSSPDDWSTNFKSRLNNAASDYEIALKGYNGTVAEEDMERYTNTLKQVLKEYNGFIADKLHNRSLVDLTIINGDYLESAPAVLNLDKACAFVKYGEKGTISISIGKYDSAKGKETALEKSNIKSADEVYAFSMQVFTTEQSVYRGEFTVPMRFEVAVGSYEEVAAVQLSQGENGEEYIPCNVTEYTNGKVVLNVRNADGTVYLFVKKKTINLKWLYLLFLLIPIGAAIAVPLIIKNRRKRSK